MANGLSDITVAVIFIVALALACAAYAYSEYNYLMALYVVTLLSHALYMYEKRHGLKTIKIPLLS